MIKSVFKTQSKRLATALLISGLCGSASAQVPAAAPAATAAVPMANTLEINLIEASDLSELTAALFAGVQNYVAKRKLSPSCVNDPVCQQKLSDLEKSERAEIYNKNGEVYQKISVLLKKEFSPAEMDWLLKVYQQPLGKRFRKFIYSQPVAAMLADFPKGVTKKMNAIAPLTPPPRTPPAAPAAPATQLGTPNLQPVKPIPAPQIPSPSVKK